MDEETRHANQSDHERAGDAALKRSKQRTDVEPTELDYQREIEAEDDELRNVDCQARCGDEDWSVVATYEVSVMRTIDDKSISKDEAIEIAAEELREAKPQDFEFEVDKGRTERAAFSAFVNDNRPEADSSAPCDAELVYDANGDITGIRFTGVEMGALEFDV